LSQNETQIFGFSRANNKYIAWWFYIVNSWQTLERSNQCFQLLFQMTLKKHEGNEQRITFPTRHKGKTSSIRELSGTGDNYSHWKQTFAVELAPGVNSPCRKNCLRNKWIVNFFCYLPLGSKQYTTPIWIAFSCSH
jgi:hypothetical protein